MTKSKLIEKRPVRQMAGLCSFADRLLRDTERLEARLTNLGKFNEAQELRWALIFHERAVHLLDPHHVKDA